MKIKEIKKIIEENKDKLPLFIENSEITSLLNESTPFESKKYKDSNFEKIKFYKPISRLI